MKWCSRTEVVRVEELWLGAGVWNLRYANAAALVLMLGAGVRTLGGRVRWEGSGEGQSGFAEGTRSFTYLAAVDWGGVKLQRLEGTCDGLTVQENMSLCVGQSASMRWVDRHNMIVVVIIINQKSVEMCL